MYVDAMNSGMIVLDQSVEFVSVGNLPKAVTVSCFTSLFSYEILDSALVNDLENWNNC